MRVAINRSGDAGYSMLQQETTSDQPQKDNWSKPFFIFYFSNNPDGDVDSLLQ